MTGTRISRSRIVEEAAEVVEYVVCSVVDMHSASLESPIEKIMLEAIVALLWSANGCLPSINGKPGIRNQFASEITITTQAQIGSYRVDFLVVNLTTDRKVVVECDGHEFHERTKEQAAHDRKRDRELQADGYLVLRYTGSEIWRDPVGCAADIRKKIGFMVPFRENDR